MKAPMLAAAGAAALLLSGCAGSSAHCMEAFPYQKATSLPPVSVPGLKEPASASALVIPPPKAPLIPYAERVQAGGKTDVQCLDEPPPFNSPASPAAVPAGSS